MEETKSGLTTGVGVGPAGTNGVPRLLSPYPPRCQREVFAWETVAGCAEWKNWYCGQRSNGEPQRKNQDEAC